MTDGNLAGIVIGCFGLGLSAGLALLLLATRDISRFLAGLNPWIARGTVALLATGSIAMILINNERAALPAGGLTAASQAMVAASGSPTMPQGPAGSMEASTQALAARLAAQGGTDEDWNLLAQSYDFLGRTEDAAQARQHKVSAQRSLPDAMAATAPVQPATVLTAPSSSAGAGGSVMTLVAQAEEHRRKREFRQAADVYRKVIAAGGMTADTWADYADALASAAPDGSLAGEPAKAIEQALKLDPKQTKALWLKASFAHQQHRYEDALAAWRALLALMPAGSSDARIIEANIAEAQRLAGKKG